VFLSDGSSKTLQKTFYKKKRVEKNTFAMLNNSDITNAEDRFLQTKRSEAQFNSQ
jgi:hypothetical protein